MPDVTLTEDSAERKATPMARGLLDYFPAALAEVARVSEVGNQKHNPGEELHWTRGKSTDHADCIIRHLADRGARDGAGVRHSAYVAWRALALLQEELEADGATPGRGSVFPGGDSEQRLVDLNDGSSVLGGIRTFRITGARRVPRKGDWYRVTAIEALRAANDHSWSHEPRQILEPVDD